MLFTKTSVQFLSFSVSLIFLLSSFPVVAQNQADEIKNKCRNAVNETKSRLEKGRKLKVVIATTRNVGETYSGYPQESPLELSFGMEGAAVESVINNSPKFLASLTKDFITQCPVVSLVTFAQYRTDFFISIGRTGNRLAIFECHPRSSELGMEKMPWGYRSCL